MDVDRTKIYDGIPVAVLFITMIAVQQLPPEIAQPVMWIGMAASIGMMFGVDAILRVEAAEYTHIEAICRPSNTKLQLFIKAGETEETELGVYNTTLYLGEKVKHPFYQTLDQIVIRHEKTWGERVGSHFVRAKAIFKGYQITHAKSARITLYEPYEGSFDVDHLNPKPKFWLKEAPGDFYFPEQEERMLVTATNGGQLAQPQEVFKMGQVKRLIEKLRAEKDEWKRQAMYWHQAAVRFEEIVDQLKNELMAVLSSKGDFKKAVVEFMLMIREAQLTILNALKHMKGLKIGFTKALAILIIGIAAIVFFMVNPGALQIFTQLQTQVFILILVGIVVAGWYYASKVRVH